MLYVSEGGRQMGSPERQYLQGGSRQLSRAPPVQAGGKERRGQPVRKEGTVREMEGKDSNFIHV